MNIPQKLKRNIIDKIYLIILCINILLLNIFIGSTHEDPRTLTQTIIILETAIYIIISKINKKEKILIKGKIDIVVIIMLISTIMPLIFKTYCSLSYTIDIFLEYLTVYSMYILVRNLITTPKRKDILINTILLSSILIIIFGMDRLNFNVFQKFYDITRASQVKDMRMTSIIGYWNAVFTYIVSLMIIALGKYIDIKNKKIAGIYAMYVQLAMYAFYYCNSRAGMIIFVLIFIVYLIKIKDTNKIIKSILLIITAFVFVVILDRIIYAHGSILVILIGVITTLIFTYILSLVFDKIINKIKIENIKKATKILTIASVSFVLIYVCIAKNYSKPMELDKFENNIMLYDLKNNNTYKIKLDLTQNEGKKVTVKVSQIDTKRKRVYLYKNVYTPINGKIIDEFEIQIAQNNLDKVQIQFLTEDNGKTILNKVYVNGKEEIVNYKYLPNTFMRLIKTLRPNNVSITERLSMYRSGVKLFSQHPIVGNGGKTFQSMYVKVREYAYSAMEVHSFYMDILMDYGIIGTTACIGIIGITIYNFIKRKDKNNFISLSIFVSWIFVAIHTIIDFDLAYMLTLSNFYIMIALINEEDKSFIKNTQILEYVVSIIMIICVLTNLYKLPGEKLYREGKYKEAMKYIPYNVKNMDGYINSQEEDPILIQKVLIRYLSNEKNIRQYRNLMQLCSISMNLIVSNNIDDGAKGLKKVVELMEHDEIIAKYDESNKELWEVYIKDIKKELHNLNQKLNNKELEEIEERINCL